MLSRITSQYYIVPALGSLLWIALTVAPAMSHAYTESQHSNEKPQNTEAENTKKEAAKQNDGNKNPAPETGKTIWLEEKLNPSTQWLEKAVKPLTRWIEGQVQLDPKGSQQQNTPRPHGQRKPQPQTKNTLAPQSNGSQLSKDQIRKLVKQRYAGDVLHIKALSNARYRVKLISQQGVIQILYLSAIDGQELTP
ncbi:hypothetical protein [uncultured Pseudoteredinibacter sp.]|uniref:hypothetical protein n=1 Tax=uncultured Pseudoteredinibacter sp. TaxID=1641701 RepID=UPI002639E04D|nr:hypothetical protein [uncultured Pseudoteredinibacter sp.]